jgi:CHAT domain-containing protein/tetratricopeptide (TPR) repeat protein
MLLGCFACLSALGLPVLSAPLGFPPVLQARIVSQLPQPASSDADLLQADLLQQGIDRYESQQYTEAIALWQQALAQLSQPAPRAFVLSNLSLAYQQLGQWQEAAEAIAQSLDLLKSAGTIAPADISARVLNTQARLLWVQSQPEAALDTWEQATAAYRQADDPTGVAIGLINQATALQALGFSVRAETQLSQAKDLLQQIPTPALQAAGLQNLGTALRRVGKLNESIAVLQQSQQLADANPLPLLQSTTRLELGNSEYALWNRARAIGQASEAQRHQQAAIGFYQQAAQLATNPDAKLQAQLNQLSLIVEIGQDGEIGQSSEIGQSAAAEPPTDLLQTIPSTIAQLSPSRSRVYAQIKLIQTLAQIKDPDQSSLADLAQQAAAVVQEARSLQDAAAESYALGQLGELYEKGGQWAAAQTLTEQAWLKAEAIQSPTIRYRWEWQLGRLLQKQADSPGAIAAYTSAVKSLQSVRQDLLLINADVQFSFRDQVEPVYRELVELLLSSGEPSQAILQQAIAQVNALQLAELENFLGCTIAQTANLETSDLAGDRTTAKLYPMILQNRLAVVLELPGEPLLYHAVTQSRTETETLLQQLREDLSISDNNPETIEGLRQVYQWLIAPFEAELAAHSQINTLAFVLDGQLRNIPMAALYSGEQFLIARYAVAIAPRLELFQPSPRSSTLNVFLGGVGEPQTFERRAFTKIEYLLPELEQIQQIANAKPPLLNTEFTEENIAARLNQEPFSAIHLKTHGIFSSDPESTFIVAYQELITGKDLGQLIQTDRIGESSPIELLVLSACSTAKGDNRAVLGLAGIALQAGAHSVVSTLWEAEDYPNTQLMIRFYQELLNPEMTRAQALRSAQLSLLAQGYTRPHIWATYVLVGNWL